MTTSSHSCQVCNTENPSHATFCITCGEPLADSSTDTSNLTGRLSPNQMLKERYHILTPIGRGGFAAVYQAQDTQLHNRQVAIKEMRQSGLSAQELSEAIRAFQLEAQLLAGLLHPNLPRVYDHFSERGRWYLVLDFIEGETLEDFLLHQADQRLSLPETLGIGLQICSVLDYLHTRRPSIIFRDLKPANIMRTPSKHLYLIDFGIARHFKPGQIKDTIAFGSPGYAAPEQYGKAQTTPQSDIYSLGVLFHHLLSGVDPAEKPFQLPPLRLYGSGMPEMEHLITRMTTLDTGQRPASVAEVKVELQVIAALSTSEHNDFQPQRQQREEAHATRRPTGQERLSEGQQEQIQEESPPFNHLRRRLIVGGVLTGVALTIGTGGFLASRPRQVVKSQLKTQTVAPRPTARPAAMHFAPEVMFGFNAQHTNFNSSETQLNPTNVSRLKLAWRSDELGKNYFSSPIVSGGSVYLVTADGRLWAFNAASGQTRWVTDEPQSSVSGFPSTVAVAKGVVYFCLPDYKLYAFDAITGQPRWVSSTANTYSSPTVVNGVVYSTNNTNLSAFDAVTGHQYWTSSSLPAADSPVAVANQTIYAVSGGNGPYQGCIYAFKAATGQLHWISDLITHGIDDNSSVVVANGIAYIGSGDGGVAAFDAATGHARWISAPTMGSTGSSPAVANGIVYHSQEQVSAFDAITGQPLWVSTDMKAFNSDSTLVANGVVYVCSAGNNCVYALDATSGKTLWISPPANDQVFTTPAVVNGMVYLASGSGGGPLYAFRLQ